MHFLWTIFSRGSIPRMVYVRLIPESPSVMMWLIDVFQTTIEVYSTEEQDMSGFGCTDRRTIHSWSSSFHGIWGQ